ncbi:hypothetical protein SAMN04490197_5387 [Pseudomonas orientalis]|uniref:Uncharacterized protein n=1 Tax=Pseudomonas orientalis TaxID=76758 RepID=A0A8B3Y4Q6_9PSED|nr:hypothetical protein SAMN04490197_5387 [Pseudomonas orientalis]
MPVGASLLAKNSQAPRSFRKHALSLTFFASKLAPTVLGQAPSHIQLWFNCSRNAFGENPTRRRNSREKFVGSENPSTSDISLMVMLV